MADAVLQFTGEVREHPQGCADMRAGPNRGESDIGWRMAEVDAPTGVDRSESVRAIDLFCGAGGLAYGLSRAGMDVAVGVDLDEMCRHPIEANTGARFEKRDVAALTAADLIEWFGDADVRVLAGCAPCQPFSTYSQSRKTPDERWNLLTHFQRLALGVRPEIVTMENVPGLATQPVWRNFVEALLQADYHVSWSEVTCLAFGVPQGRSRLVLMASLLGPLELEPPDAVPQATVRDTIAGLPPLAAGEADEDDPMHMACRLSPLNLQRIRASSPGGTWRDWPEDLVAGCHLRETGKTYPGVYGRMVWDRPAPTMTTQCYGFGNGRFGHPEQDRAISLREAALLQSFPQDYSFTASPSDVSFRRHGILIGNAVPPKLGEAIGRSIVRHSTQMGG